jgi:hypothetical protein
MPIDTDQFESEPEDIPDMGDFGGRTTGLVRGTTGRKLRIDIGQILRCTGRMTGETYNRGNQFE